MWSHGPQDLLECSGCFGLDNSKCPVCEASISGKKQKAVILFSGYEDAPFKENLIEAQDLDQENNDENNDVPNTEKVMTGNKDMQNDRAGLVGKEDDESESKQEHMESKSSKSER